MFSKWLRKARRVSPVALRFDLFLTDFLADKSVVKMDVSVAREAGLPFDERLSPPAKKEGRAFFHVDKKLSSAKKPRTYVRDGDPIVHLGMSNREVHAQTGFKGMNYLLFNVFAICEGDANLIRMRQTSLTWLEEWYFFFEYMYGRTVTS